MSKTRNTQLKIALKLACEEIDRLSDQTDNHEAIQASRAYDPEFWLDRARKREPLQSTSQETTTHV